MMLPLTSRLADCLGGTYIQTRSQVHTQTFPHLNNSIVGLAGKCLFHKQFQGFIIWFSSASVQNFNLWTFFWAQPTHPPHNSFYSGQSIHLGCENQSITKQQCYNNSNHCFLFLWLTAAPITRDWNNKQCHESYSLQQLSILARREIHPPALCPVIQSDIEHDGAVIIRLAPPKSTWLSLPQ